MKTFLWLVRMCTFAYFGMFYRATSPMMGPSLATPTPTRGNSSRPGLTANTGGDSSLETGGEKTADNQLRRTVHNLHRKSDTNEVTIIWN